MPTKGIILVGGKSRRFGSDKALAQINGVTLLERAIHLLEGLKLNPAVITSAEKENTYSFLECPILKDLIPDKGPLGGLYTAFSAFPDSPLLILTCDMPYLSASLLKRLFEHHQKENLITLYRLEEKRIHPFPGIYAPALLSTVLEDIHTNQLAMHRFIEKAPSVQFIQPNESLEVFRNINEHF